LLKLTLITFLLVCNWETFKKLVITASSLFKSFRHLVHKSARQLALSWKALRRASVIMERLKDSDWVTSRNGLCKNSYQ